MCLVLLITTAKNKSMLSTIATSHFIRREFKFDREYQCFDFNKTSMQPVPNTGYIIFFTIFFYALT